MRPSPVAPAVETDPSAPGDADRCAIDAAASHDFFSGCGLPARWQGRDGFSILETDFGLGHGFLSSWDAWRRDPLASDRLTFVSIASDPPAGDVLRATHRGSALADLAGRLAAAWPPATKNLHRLAFDGGRVELLLAIGAVAPWLRELEVAADAFFIEAEPGGEPVRWDAALGKALGRLAAREATLCAHGAGDAVRRHLGAAGFELRPGGRDDRVLACFRPVHTPRASARRARQPGAERRALIVGGGLAGTAAAAALAERGWRSSLFERRDALASEASGNPAGLFHGTVHAEDGVHARFSRAAALAVAPHVESALADHGVAGAVAGFLRLEARLGLAAMRALLARSGLPPSYVDALDAETASALAGIRLPCPAWHYPRGGWVDPAGLVRACAARAGNHLETRTGVAVESIRSEAGRWHLLDATGTAIDDAGVLVLANAGDALRLLGDPGWPVERVRGQIAGLAPGAMPERLARCRLPVAGSGYLIPTPQGLVFGATRQRGDDDAAVRGSDNAQNVARLEALVGAPLGIESGSVTGRTAWRCTARDRLPLIGAVPELGILAGDRGPEPRWDRPRHVPREPGLFLFSGLGSRGITVSALGAQVLAAGIAGTAVPLESSLLDAIDPARFVSRSARFAAPPRARAAAR